jgi:hypothetical protein
MANQADRTPACVLVAIDIAKLWNAAIIEYPDGKRQRFQFNIRTKTTTAWSDFCKVLGLVAGLRLNRPVSTTGRWHTDSCTRVSRFARYRR